MTRNEFLDDVTWWDELLDFCSEYSYDGLDDIYDACAVAECLGRDLRDYGQDYSWKDICEWLNQIDQDADYYRYNSLFEYESVDADFADYKQATLDWGDAMEIWDEEESQDNVDGSDGEEETMENGELLPIAELFSGCNGTLQTLRAEAEADAKEETAKFEAFICCY